MAAREWRDVDKQYHSYRHINADWNTLPPADRITNTVVAVDSI
jgi:hypothetical protein